MNWTYFEHDVMYFIVDNWLWICLAFIAIEFYLGWCEGRSGK